MPSDDLFWSLWNKAQRIKQLIANLSDEVEQWTLDVEAAHLVPVVAKPKAQKCAIRIHQPDEELFDDNDVY